MKVHALLSECFGKSGEVDAVAEKYVLERDEEIQPSEQLQKQIVRHMKQVVSHRKWLLFAYRLVTKADPSLASPSLERRVLDHDLSKFSKEELSGYAAMWGRDEQEKQEKLSAESEAAWASSLRHHYASNDHHPEHFGGGADMQPEEAFIESLFDKFACRLERNLYVAGCGEVSPQDVFDVPAKYFVNYSLSDRDKVAAMLEKWCDVLSERMGECGETDVARFVEKC